MNNNLPVYLITGFLEGGKTRFIQEMLSDSQFNTGEKTLLLVCEEGIEEYDPAAFAAPNVRFVSVDSEKELTRAFIDRQLKLHRYDRIVVEYNGMWNPATLYDALPDNAFINDQIMVVDSTTFENYNANMRQQSVFMITDAEYILFNRCTEKTDIGRLHKIVRANNRRCGISYEYTDGHTEDDTFEDPLPFDVNAPVIVIEDRDYALFYRDLSENMKNYNGKTVKFKGVAATDRSLPAGNFIIGRHVMTCCAADITYMGLAARTPVILQQIKDYDWFVIEAKISIERNPIYRAPGPVLVVKSLSRTTQPDEPVATFY